MRYNHPTVGIRVSVESMRHELMALLSKHETDIEQEMRRQVEAHVTPEAISDAIRSEVVRQLDDVIRSAVRRGLESALSHNWDMKQRIADLVSRFIPEPKEPA